MNRPEVTIICVPRERFSFARESLRNLYENTRYPFRLVYVDNRAPRTLRRFLTQEAAKRGFELVRAPYFLSPNQARNLGLQRATGKYIVFIDNDVVFEAGWLEKLVRCAEQTNGTIVGPLVCQHQPLHTFIHCAGGEFMPAEELEQFRRDPLPTLSRRHTSANKWNIREKIYLQGKRIEKCELERRQTGFVEFHCLLIQRDFLLEHGNLDEGFLITKEYLDLAMTVIRAGGSIWLEPDSKVTFLTHFPAPPLTLSDLPYYSLRWNDEWMLANLAYMRHKWDLIENTYFLKRYGNLGWRRRIEIIRPLCTKIPHLSKDRQLWLTTKLTPLEQRLNRLASRWHAKRVARASKYDGGMIPRAAQGGKP